MFSKCLALHLCRLAILLLITIPSWGASNFFQPVQTYASGGWRTVSVATADVNGDGKLDLLVANRCVLDDNCTLETGGIGRGAVGVLLGNGDGTFQPAQAYVSGGYAATSITVGDVNGDGKADLVVSHHCGDSDCSGRTVVGVLLGNGDGTFQPAKSYGTGGYGGPYDGGGPGSVAVGDINRDGKADIVVANALVRQNEFDRGDKLVGVLLGNGDGTFQPVQLYNSGDAAYAVSVALADVNKDGSLDLLVGHADGNFAHRSTVGVLLGNGDGTFQAPRKFSSGGYVANQIRLDDMNGDGKLDLLVVNLGRRVNRWSNSVVALRLGNGDGTFGAVLPISQSGSGGASSIGVADLNLDGKSDLLIKDRQGLRTWLGNGDGTFQLPGPSGTSATAGISVAVADLNDDGRPDVAVSQGCINFDECTPGVGVLLNAIPFATTTALSSNLNPAEYGQAITFTAAVTYTGPYAPTGKVKFLDDTLTIGTATVNGGFATLTYSKLLVGKHGITARYAGDIDSAKSTSAILEQVVK